MAERAGDPSPVAHGLRLRESLLAVGSVDSLKSALLHPIPPSRRPVIRVDIFVDVDVMRVAFWMRVS